MSYTKVDRTPQKSSAFCRDCQSLILFTVYKVVHVGTISKRFKEAACSSEVESTYWPGIIIYLFGLYEARVSHKRNKGRTI